MKLSKYIKHLQKIVKDNPEAINYEVIYAIDEEGNGFQPVEILPCIGFFEAGEFWTEGDEELTPNFMENSVCVN